MSDVLYRYIRHVRSLGLEEVGAVLTELAFKWNTEYLAAILDTYGATNDHGEVRAQHAGTSAGPVHD